MDVKKSEKVPHGAPIGSNFLGFSGTVEEKTLKSFGYFWATKMAPTLAGPGLFWIISKQYKVTRTSHDFCCEKLAQKVQAFLCSNCLKFQLILESFQHFLS